MASAAQLVVITGGSQGIGRALVHCFLREGFAVATCARSGPNLAELQAAMSEQFPMATLHVLPADLSRAADCQQFAEFVLALGLPLAALVNNAGAFVPGRFQDEPADGSRLREVLAVNLLSAYDVTRALLPTLLGQGRGHIFTICSTASLMPYPSGGSYGVAKFALLGFTKTLREEVKTQGLRVTAVLPGATLTRSWEGVGMPAERFIDPLDVAEAVLSAFRLSPQAVVEEILIRPQLGDVL
ncbi:SDR family NAD(P)-dependent oxidoreductase [Hymenobacter sp. HMF4947]|uniref:SDR family NAD(P)-dependent oxidoreductase n=1 Tax=Hymenobacter ginkgonis TaxID=2682976 RepID=A0A7K1TA95_9BACT|nr:SDR family oxidoreductase [Hymenobacter ginkgonis]MVN75336.1 SDR family NAD(P)-dependent oxidoreductase [Hymenobacter ginkgonis]